MKIKICSQNKCHHHLSNVCENSFRMFHSNWVISDYHSFVWQFEFPWLNPTNCRNKWMVIRNDPVTVKHTKWIFTDVGKVMMASILATDFDFIAYMSKMALFFFFFFWSFFHANGVFGTWYCHQKMERWEACSFKENLLRKHREVFSNLNADGTDALDSMIKCISTESAKKTFGIIQPRSSMCTTTTTTKEYWFDAARKRHLSEYYKSKP